MKKIIIVLLLFTNLLLFSQTKDTLNDRYWATIGMKLGALPLKLTLPTIGINYARRKSKYEIRYSYLIVGALFNGKNYDRFKRFDLLYGRGIVHENYYLMLSGGITLFQDITYYKIRDDLNIYSFPLELEYFLKAFKYYGFGFSLSIDLNPKIRGVNPGIKLGLGKVK